MAERRVCDDWGVAYGDRGAEFVPGKYIKSGYTFTSRVHIGPAGNSGSAFLRRVRKDRPDSSVNSILKNNLDRQRPAKPADGPAIGHDNIRGPTYFH